MLEHPFQDMDSLRSVHLHEKYLQSRKASNNFHQAIRFKNTMNVYMKPRDIIMWQFTVNPNLFNNLYMSTKNEKTQPYQFLQILPTRE